MSTPEPAWQANAKAHLLAARQHSSRLGRKKSRTGCLTCKARRIKCDERRPLCQRCRSSSRACEWPSSLPRDATPASTATSRDLDIRVLSPNRHSLDPAESRSFDYFLSWAAPRLGGFLDQDFWCGHVLRFARTEPLVMDSLLAISMLYEHPQYMASFQKAAPQPTGARNRGAESRESASVSPTSTPDFRHVNQYSTNDSNSSSTGTVSTNSAENDLPPPPDEHHAEALRFYNRAIRQFRMRVEQGKATPLLALFSCVLFICIETIRDSVPSTLALIAQGLNMVRNWDMNSLQGDEKGLFILIRRIFERFSVVAITFGQVQPVSHREPAMTTRQTMGFETSHDARSALFDLMGESHEFIKKTNERKEALVLRDSILELHEFADQPSSDKRFVVPASLHGIMSDGTERPYRGFFKTEDQREIKDAEGIGHPDLPSVEQVPKWTGDNVMTELLELEHRVLVRLQQWKSAFEVFRASKALDQNTASYLLMYYHTSLIWMSTRIDPRQTAFDGYTHDFEEILWHAEIYVAAKASEKPVFTFEIGAVPPLYFVAAKCRVPSLRRRALALMRRAPPKEAIWGAMSTAELATRLAAIEEEGLGMPHPDEWVEDGAEVDDAVLPLEEKRIHTLELLQYRISRVFDIRITRYASCNGRLRRVVEELPV